MTRREVLGTLAAAGTGLTLGAPFAGRAQGSRSRPNVLFIFTDDQRFDTIHALGNDEIVTPNLDALVSRGVTFTHAYIMGGTSGAVCIPSRAMLMTGRSLFHLQNVGQGIPPEHVTFPEALRQAGYATFGTGKWHNGTPSYARSFSAGGEVFFGGMADHWNVPLCDFSSSGEYPKPRELKARWGKIEMTLSSAFDHIRSGEHSSDLFTDAVVRFLKGYRDEAPFLAYIAYTAPHDPRETHQRYHDLYDVDAIRLPGNFLAEHPFDNRDLRTRDEKLAAWPRTPREIREHIADYYAMISHLDAQVGRLLETLKETGQAENTIIVFAGDNGLAVGQHGLMGKQNLYEHSIHVPLIIAGPGIPRNERRDGLCYLTDIFPTLCELTGMATPATVDGQSLVPLMHDSTAVARERLLFAYTDCQRAVRDERYKLIEYAVNGTRTTQLFDLRDDPWETRNLADDPAGGDHLQRLRTELQRWRAELGDTRPMGERFWATYDEHS
ncbi:MAG: sulfatase-like hydrolase/transferase [Armatimonadota bacterium]|nr:MAG: sulfatase-like hydrolase/transferase [Armatimonadota bacterium]